MISYRDLALKPRRCWVPGAGITGVVSHLTWALGTKLGVLEVSYSELLIRLPAPGFLYFFMTFLTL